MAKKLIMLMFVASMCFGMDMKKPILSEDEVGEGSEYADRIEFVFEDERGAAIVNICDSKQDFDLLDGRCNKALSTEFPQIPKIFDAIEQLGDVEMEDRLFPQSKSIVLYFTEKQPTATFKHLEHEKGITVHYLDYAESREQHKKVHELKKIISIKKQNSCCNLL